MVATEKLERFAGSGCLQLEDRFLDLRCVLTARQRYIHGVPTRVHGYEGQFENLPFLEARRALLARTPLRMTLADGSRFRVAVIDTSGSFTAEPLL